MKTLKKNELQEIIGGDLGLSIGIAVSIGLFVITQWDCLKKGYEQARGN